MPLPKLEGRPTLAEQAYETLLQAIQSLEIEPGQKIPITDLSQQMGISRTPLKSALVRLEKDGLLEIIPYEGVQVTSLVKRDIDEILELRMLLEGFAAAKAAEQLSAQELEEAEGILRQTEEAFAAGDYGQAAQTGHKFHELILSKVTNDRLINFVNLLDKQYRRIRLYVAKELPRGDRSNEDHRRILDALTERDGAKASEAMQDHLATVRKELLDYLADDARLSALLVHGSPDGTGFS
jgi:DNA-binding GntR family transcriptional regulator